MGVVVDTSVFTICERQRWTSMQVGLYIASLFPTEQIVIPSVVAAELVHGIYRAKTPEQRAKRNAYIKLLLGSYTVVPFTENVAWLAGRVRGEQAQAGNTLPLADTFIAATALDLNYSVLTHNVKDFVRIPGLHVIPFTLP
jgi:tRNA(fMet)-specific endonuclease VapC